MDYTDEFLKKVLQLGILNYPYSKVVNVLDIKDEIQFKEDFYNQESIIYKTYQKGIDQSDFVLDVKLYELAKEGDLKAIKEFKNRKIELSIQEKKNE